VTKKRGAVLKVTLVGRAQGMLLKLKRTVLLKSCCAVSSY